MIDTMDNDPNEPAPSYQHARWEKHLHEIDLEIAQLAVMCGVPLLDPGVIERVLRNDSLVCAKSNPRAFEKLRSLLMMHYSVRDKAIVALGEAQTLAMVGDIVERLRKRIGDKLGGPVS
jgi:hypothetical protein